MDFEKICMMFTMQEPYYGILLSAMDRVPSNKIGTLGVGRSGNVFKLIYNPDFIAKLSVDATLELLKHEVLHVAFEHFTLWENNNVSPDEHRLRNYAEDMEVNGYLDISKIEDLGPVQAKQFGWEDHLGTREYYSRLQQKIEQQQQQAQAQQPQQSCNGGQGGNQQQPQQQNQQTSQQQQSQQQGQQQTQSGTQPSGAGNQQQADASTAGSQTGTSSGQGTSSGATNTFLDDYTPIDDHSMWPDCNSETELQLLKQTIEDMLDFAAEEVEKGRGSIPSEMKGRIDKIRKRKPKPVADWKRFFRRYLGNEFTEFIRKSKKRESRRFPDAAGNRHRRKSHILVAIDTSGSVSMPEYREFMGQIKTLTSVADFRILECDARIQYEYDFKGKISEILHGGGGTDYQSVIDYFNKDKRKYDALVYFTDGYCNVPKDTPKDTLWVISSKGVKDRKPFRINGASCIIIPEPKKQ